MAKKIFLFIMVLLNINLIYAEKPYIKVPSNAQSTVIDNQENSIRYGNDYDYVTFEHYKSSLEEENTVMEAKGEKLYHKVSLTANKKTSNLLLKNKKQQEKPFYLRGYCSLPHQIQVERLSAVAVLKCNFDKGNGVLTALFVPDIYSKALIGKPLYITFNKNSNKRYYVTAGVIMNAQKTSINLATVVNDRKIDRLIVKTGLDSANIITQNALNYLQAKLQANTQQKITYLDNPNGGVTPVQTTNTKPPKVSDYLTVTAVQLLSNLMKNVSDTFYQDLPYLFKIDANTLFYVDLFVNPQLKGLPNFDKNTNNIVVKNPPYSKTQPSSILLKGEAIKGNK